MNRVLIVFGTRPEAIKMAPVVHAFKRSGRFDTKVCVTAQHREMLDHVLEIFQIVPDFDLNVMRPNQQLPDLTVAVLYGVRDSLIQWKPDLVMVQGDTTTTFAAALAASYEKIPVGHIEAGLRTGNKHSPWPEEINRCLTTVLAAWHFAPTEWARRNLIVEGVDPRSVIVTGNTVIDALREIASRVEREPGLREFYDRQFSYLNPKRRLVLVTGHRRENFGEGFQRICTALRELSARPDVEIIYPVHLNPNVRNPVGALLGHISNVHLLEPQEYLPFAYLLKRSHFIITDSGGIQEEAPVLGKPVLLMRDTTERPEAVEAGTVKLVGTDVRTLCDSANELLDDQGAYDAMARAANPFGDGFAAQRILKHVEALKEPGATTHASLRSRI